MNPFFQKLVLFFRSMRFINFLLVVLAAVVAFGTLPESVKLFSVSPQSVFHQGWFFALLGYLAFAAAWYVLRKTARLLKGRQRQIISLADQVSEAEPAERFKIPRRLTPDHENMIARTVSDRRYHVTIEKNGDVLSFFARKNQWGRWGGPILHAGFVVVLLGGLLTFLFSDVRDVMIPEGETVTLPKSKTKMKLEKFVVLLGSHPAKPDNYLSRLLVERENGRVTREDLMVNHPLKIGQTKMFQMRYRVEIPSLELLVYRAGKAVERIELVPKEKKALTQFPALVEVSEVIPDFVMNDQGMVSSRTPYFRNPAAFVSLYSAERPDQASQTAWAFEDIVSHKERPNEEWSFTVQKIKKRYVSGIKLSRDPGVPLAYAGYFLLILGAFVTGFVFPRQFMLVLKPVLTGGGGFQVEMVYVRSKDVLGVQRDIKMIKAKLSSALGLLGT